MTITERRRVNAPYVQIIAGNPATWIPMARAMAFVKALRVEYPRITKAMLTPEAASFWLE